MDDEIGRVTLEATTWELRYAMLGSDQGGVCAPTVSRLRRPFLLCEQRMLLRCALYKLLSDCSK